MSPSSSRKRRIDEFTKKRAAKIIQRLTMPYKNRVTLDFDERIKTYTQYSKYFEKSNDKNNQPHQCLTVSKVNGKVTFSIADNIILFKKIGSKSKYGAIYLSKGTNEGRTFRFASKIMPIDDYNITEVQAMTHLTKEVIAKKNPHFPIMYQNFACLVPSNNSDLPAEVNNEPYLVSLCELANGDAKMFIEKFYNNDKKIKNALTQIFISIYSYHSLGYLHNDTQWGNFLYHRIEAGGYIKYIINGKELYLENIGYLWVIWDFSFTDAIDPNNMIDITFEYMKILVVGFRNKNINGVLSDEYPYSKNIIQLSSKVLSIIDECKSTLPYVKNAGAVFFDKFLAIPDLFLKKEELPEDAVIVNKGAPYKIGS
jgi:hypothetical protein